jgi:hypothetical protein
MNKKDFKLYVKTHEIRLLTAGVLLGMAVKSKSKPARIAFVIAGILTSLGDLVQVREEAAERWTKSVEKKIDAFFAKHFPDSTGTKH